MEEVCSGNVRWGQGGASHGARHCHRDGCPTSFTQRTDAGLVSEVAVGWVLLASASADLQQEQNPRRTAQGY